MWVDRRAVRGDGEEPTPPSGLERRRGAGRRLSDFTRSAEEGELTKEQFLFLMAVESFKKANQKQFPSWTDVLEVVRLLGYRKTMPMELTLGNAEDWREAPNTASNVRPDRWHERAA
jgi:alpha-ketoglutarate-dependent taurine dioxygenase